MSIDKTILFSHLLLIITAVYRSPLMSFANTIDIIC